MDVSPYDFWIGTLVLVLFYGRLMGLMVKMNCKIMSMMGYGFRSFFIVFQIFDLSFFILTIKYKDIWSLFF